jgi:hypothetical protein
MKVWIVVFRIVTFYIANNIHVHVILLMVQLVAYKKCTYMYMYAYVNDIVIT